MGPSATTRVLMALSASLTVAASVALMALGAWLVGSLWLVVATTVATGIWTLRPASRTTRVILAGGLVPLLVVLTWEGGLFYVPAAVALVIAQVFTPPTRKPVPHS